MNNRKEVYVKIVDLDKYSYVEKYFDCEKCHCGNKCADMANCPMINNIARDVWQTKYSIDASKLRINTATYGHDFRRALNVVNAAMSMQRYRR